MDGDGDGARAHGACRGLLLPRPAGSRTSGARGTSPKAIAARTAWQLRKREATRESLRRTGLTLFAERGYENVTTSHVATAAGVSPVTFFRYFPTKEDLVLGMLPSREFLETLRTHADLSGSPLQIARRVGLHLVRGLDADQLRDLVRVVRLIEITPALIVALRARRPGWTAGIDALFPPGADEFSRRLASRVILDYLVETLLWWAVHTSPERPDLAELAHFADLGIAAAARMIPGPDEDD